MPSERLTKEDAEEISNLVVEKLSKSTFIDNDRHWAEHEFVRQQMEAKIDTRQSRVRIFEKIIGSIATLGLLGIFGWVGHAIWVTVMSAISKGVP